MKARQLPAARQRVPCEPARWHPVAAGPALALPLLLHLELSDQLVLLLRLNLRQQLRVQLALQLGLLRRVKLLKRLRLLRHQLELKLRLQQLRLKQLPLL